MIPGPSAANFARAKLNSFIARQKNVRIKLNYHLKLLTGLANPLKGAERRYGDALVSQRHWISYQVEALWMGIGKTLHALKRSIVCAVVSKPNLGVWVGAQNGVNRVRRNLTLPRADNDEKPGYFARCCPREILFNRCQKLRPGLRFGPDVRTQDAAELSCASPIALRFHSVVALTYLPLYLSTYGEH